MREKDIERSICDYLYLKRYFFWKQPNGGYFDTAKKRFRPHASKYVLKGIPDIIIIYKGRFIGIEVKSKKGVTSEYQRAFKNHCEANRGYYFVVRSVDDIERYLKDVHNELHED